MRVNQQNTYGDVSVGAVVTNCYGYRWRVDCIADDGTLGLVPHGLRHRFFWWLKRWV